MIERKIVINLIVSTDFHIRLQDLWETSLFESATAKRLATWCVEYFKKYNKAPGRAIESIFFEKVKAGLSKELAEEIEEEILPSLSEEFESEQEINLDFMVDQALKYFNERRLIKHADEIKALVETNQLIEAESKASKYTSFRKDNHSWVDLSDNSVLQKIETAFDSAGECLIEFPKALGEFWNEQLVRGGFVALMGSEKRGKTFWLLEFAMKACKQKRKVAFFQAGDMSESEQLKRIAIHLTKKSNKEKYCGEMYEPVPDCVLNQISKCKRDERESDFGVFEGKPESFIKHEVTFDEIRKEYDENPEYKPCTNCELRNQRRLGAVWLQKVNVGSPLTVEEAQNAFTKFFIRYKRSFKLSTHANGTLTVKQSEAIMDVWEKEGFVPDVIIYDYPDIMEDDTREFRHKQNEIWKALRGVSQKRHALVIVVTQADADSYTKSSLKLSNFSEDKRKYGHVTAMYGLNQDPGGREKELGIMRINEIVVREGEFNTNHQIHVLQNLKRGRPFLTSYW